MFQPIIDYFDLLIYITGIVERQMNKIYQVKNYEKICVTAFDQFTEVLIMGCEQVLLMEEKGKR